MLFDLINMILIIAENQLVMQIAAKLQGKLRKLLIVRGTTPRTDASIA